MNMPALESIPIGLIKKMIEEDKKTYLQVSLELKQLFPLIPKGLSVPSIKRFCCNNNIHKTSRLSETEINQVVRNSVLKVGPTYGRKTMTGLLAAEGLRVSEKRVGHALKITSAGYHTSRTSVAGQRINPVPYRANYFGEKVHIDQNEKLVMFGCTHVCAIDGYSGLIVGFVTMPVKNNILIYEHLYMKMLQDYGVWDQIRVDHGREWYLMLSVQESLSSFRYNCSKPAFLQTTSKLNHTVERIWCEVNSRVNFPLKAVLCAMMERNEINVEDELHLYCVSYLTREVAAVGIHLFIQAWNHHPIPGRKSQVIGPHVPIQAMRANSHIKKINECFIPNPAVAVQEYRQNVGSLSDPSTSFLDPLHTDSTKQLIRECAFNEKFPSISDLFFSLVNMNSDVFKNALKFYIDVTFRLMHS